MKVVSRTHTFPSHSAVVVFGLLVLVGCQTPLASCSASSSLLGSWRYDGVQDAPAAQTSGTLTVTSESCDGFEARLDVIETDGTGRVRRLAGPASGRVIDETSIRFDAFLEEAPRQHVATVHGDAVEGSWLVVGGASQGSRTGTFTLAKETSP